MHTGRVLIAAVAVAAGIPAGTASTPRRAPMAFTTYRAGIAVLPETPTTVAAPPAVTPPPQPAAPTPPEPPAAPRPAAAPARAVLRPAAVPAPAAPRPAARPATLPPAPGERAAAAEAAFDLSGWDWRRAGITLRLGHHPKRCCHWGVYDETTRTVWLGPGAFATPARARYVALHEIAHAWQWSTGHLRLLAADMGPWHHRGLAAIEAGADCLAKHWGATRRGHYWACPPDAQATVARRLGGDWAHP